MATFKVGDRVRCVKSFGNADTVNELGTIVAKDDAPEMYGVDFDKFIHGHSLDGKCVSGYGWWIPEDMLEKSATIAKSSLWLMAILLLLNLYVIKTVLLLRLLNAPQMMTSIFLWVRRLLCSVWLNNKTLKL